MKFVVVANENTSAKDLQHRINESKLQGNLSLGFEFEITIIANTIGSYFLIDCDGNDEDRNYLKKQNWVMDLLEKLDDHYQVEGYCQIAKKEEKPVNKVYVVYNEGSKIDGVYVHESVARARAAELNKTASDRYDAYKVMAKTVDDTPVMPEHKRAKNYAIWIDVDDVDHTIQVVECAETYGNVEGIRLISHPLKSRFYYYRLVVPDNSPAVIEMAVQLSWRSEMHGDYSKYYWLPNADEGVC